MLTGLLGLAGATFSMCDSQGKSISERFKKEKADGEVKFPSTKVPLPLGRYIQLSQPSACYSFTTPDANGNGEMTVLFDFEILRHVPNIEYLTFKVEPVKWVDGAKNFRVKLKKDQQAVEKLASAIVDDKASSVSVEFGKPYNDIVEQELDELKKQWNGTEVQFDNSTIYVKVPQSKIHISGEFSQSLVVTKPATIHLDSYNNSSIKLSLSMDVQTDSTDGHFNLITATIKTADGNFEATLSNSDGYFRYMDLPDVNQPYFIAPKEMDKLLSSPVEININIK